MSTTIYDPAGKAIEIAPGRGDLRFSSFPGAIRQSSQLTTVGGKTVSYAELFATQPWIAAAVMRLMTWAALVPLKCYRRTSPETTERLYPPDHPLAAVIERPWLGRELGPATQTALVQHLLGPLLVHGNALMNIVNDSSGLQLEPIDWRFVLPLGLQDGQRLYGWRVQQGLIGEDLAVADTVHVSWWSSLGPLGLSPLEQLGITVQIEDAAQRFQRGLFNNGARPPSAITTSQEFLTLERSERQLILEKLREDMNSLYVGVDNAGRPPILPPGLDWKAVGQTAVEAELVNQRMVTRQEVAAVYQLIPEVIGATTERIGSTLEIARQMGYTDALGPPMVMLEQILTAILARDTLGEDDVYVEFDFGPVLRGDRIKEINALRAGIGSAIYTPNEARRALNMAPSDEDGADELYLPVNNLQPIGTPPANSPPDPSSTGATDPANAADAAEAGVSDDLDTIAGVTEGGFDG